MVLLLLWVKVTPVWSLKYDPTQHTKRADYNIWVGIRHGPLHIENVENFENLLPKRSNLAERRKRLERRAEKEKIK